MSETQTLEELQQRVMRKTVWDYLFFASLGVVALWLVLKVMGVI